MHNRPLPATLTCLYLPMNETAFGRLMARAVWNSDSNSGPQWHYSFLGS